MKREFLIWALLTLCFQLPGFAGTNKLNVRWDPNPESDVAHYKLYRAVNNLHRFQLLDSISHPLTRYTDTKEIEPGNLYAYTLSAVDTAGNVSEFSDTVYVGVPKIEWSLTSIPEGKEVIIPLDQILSDPDNDISELRIVVQKEKNISATIRDGNLILKAVTAHYRQKAEFRLLVEDPHNFFDEKDIQLQVERVTDLTGESVVPARFFVSQNYPNPFNPTTEIKYSLPESTPVKIEIFSALSQKIKTVLNETRPAGIQRIAWDGTDDLNRAVASGRYFLLFSTPTRHEVRKLLLIR